MALQTWKNEIRRCLVKYLGHEGMGIHFGDHDPVEVTLQTLRPAVAEELRQRGVEPTDEMVEVLILIWPSLAAHAMEAKVLGSQQVFSQYIDDIVGYSLDFGYHEATLADLEQWDPVWVRNRELELI